MEMTAGFMADLGEGVAQRLSQARGETWRVTASSPDDGRAYPDVVISQQGGPAALKLIWGWYSPGKVTVVGLLPEGVPGRSYRANVDQYRAVAALVTAAGKRVLQAGYLDDLPGLVASKARRDETFAKRRALLGRVAALFGQPAPDNSDSKVHLSEFVEGAGYVECYHGQRGDALNIDLSGVPGEVMLRMLQVLADSQPDQA